MPEEIVKRVGQYELRKVLGKGGMATVWRAYQASLDREVALKLMAPQFTDEEDFIKRFNQEARSIARLRHSNILSIFEYGQDNGQPFIVTELLDGGTLREFMNKGLDLRSIGRILSQMADALDYAHAQGMVHRDIKPSNILMGTQRVFGDRAVLADFGIVKLLASTNITQTGVGVGTPEYMSPEQAAGEPLDGRSDQYSLGVVLYEMLTGVTPYKADTPLAVLMGHVNRPLPDPRTFNPRLTDQMVAVLSKTLSKFPASRFSTAGEFSDAFQEAIAPLIPSGPATSTRSTGPLAQNQAPNIATPLNVPTYTPTGAGGLPQPISSAQAYDFALLQERQGNTQAAFETFSDIYRREPGYRDVSGRLQDYQGQHYQYSGQHSLYRPFQPATLSLGGAPPASTRIEAYVPQDPTSPRQLNAEPGMDTQIHSGSYGPGTLPRVEADIAVPVAPAIKARRPAGLLIGLGILAAALLAGVIVTFITLTGGKSTGGPTPVSVATSATTAAATGNTITENTDATARVTTPTPAITTARVAGAPSPTSPKTRAEKPDSAALQVRQITDRMYKPDGDLKAGIEQLKQIATSNKTSWLAQRELGRAYYWYVREQGGLAYLKEATSLNPDDALSFAYLALAYFERFDDANALAAVTKATSLDPNSAEVKAAFSLTLLRNDPKRALDEAQAALKIDADNPLVNWSGWTSFLVTGQFSTALPFLEKVEATYPKFASVLSAKGYHYQLEGSESEAETWYKEALKLDPDFPYAHTGLGQIARLNRQFDEAIQQYQAAIKAYPNDVNAYTGLGYALDAKARSDEAEANFRKALALDVRNQEAYNGLALSYISRATSPSVKGNKQITSNFLNQAIQNADQAIKLAPSYPDAYYQKGYATFLLEKYTEAESPLKRATELDSKNAVYYTVLAYNYYQLKDNSSARQAVQKALDIDPDFQDAKSLLKALGG